MATFGQDSGNVVALTAEQICNGFAKCAGTDQIKMNSSGLNSVIAWVEQQVGGTDVFLSGLQSYDAGTNTLTLLMSDGSTVDVDMTDLLNDAVASVVFPVDPDASATVRGWVNNVSGQELGGVDKRVNGITVGRGSLNDIASTAVGRNANLNGTGISGSFFGFDAGRDNTGASVVGIGRGSALSNTGALSTYVGHFSGRGATAERSVGLGAFAGENSSGGFATAVGYLALGTNTGLEPTVVGYRAGGNVDGGGNSTANSGDFLVAVGSETALSNSGDDATFVGARAGGGNTFNNAGGFGADSSPTQDNEIALGDAALVSVRSAGVFFGAGFTTVSDSRNKDNQKEIDADAAVKLSRLVTFSEYDLMTSWSALERANARGSTTSDSEKGSRQGKTYSRNLISHQAGVIAQDLQKATKEVGAFEWLVKESADGELSVDYQSLFAVLHVATSARLAALEVAATRQTRDIEDTR